MRARGLIFLVHLAWVDYTSVIFYIRFGAIYITRSTITLILKINMQGNGMTPASKQVDLERHGMPMKFYNTYHLN